MLITTGNPCIVLCKPFTPWLPIISQNFKFQQEIRNSMKDLLHKMYWQLLDHMDEQQWEIRIPIDSHITYSQNQLTTTFNWHLKHLHTLVLQDTKEMMEPFFTALQQIQTEVSACSRSLDVFNAVCSSSKHSVSQSTACNHARRQRGWDHRYPA